ncbi:MAG TPA: LysR family transcriptional regulator [Usitatibacteraceae bacterium]|jgi:DNA-binding transcriptional LysR family regulator|nr:LysR family transcriptional regulator [Usitatibacteraceae bacterium]
MALRHATVRQLRVFEAVARHASFSRAAEELHLTQPAVSMQVKALETQAGLPLIEQVGKRLALTDAGREIHARAGTVIRELALADDALAALRGLTQGRLPIGAVSTAKYLTPPLLSRFLGAHPGVQLELAIDNRELVIAKLAANEIDLAIMGRPPAKLDAVAEPFANHPHVVVAPPDHPLAGRRRIPVETLARERFVVREPGSGTRTLLEKVFADAGFAVPVAMQMASNETIKQAVIAGLGLAFLSRHTLGLELGAGRLVALDVVGLPVVRQWFVVSLAAKRLSPAAAACKAFILEEGPRLLAGAEWGTDAGPAGRKS